MKFRINFSRDNIPYILFCAMFLFVFFHRYFIELGSFDFIRYILDVLNILLFFYSFIKGFRLGNIGKIMCLCYGVIFIWGTIAMFSSIGKWQFDIDYYLFDVRNLFRFLIFFLSCISLLKEDDVERLFNVFLAFHVINSLYIIYQYFTLEVTIFWMRGDNLNGFFGTTTGGNIYVNVLLVATSIIVLNRFVHKQCSKKFVLFILALNIVIATLIELKAFFIEFLVIIVLYLLPYLKKITRKQLLMGSIILVGGTIFFLQMINILYTIYPWMEDTLSLSNLTKFASDRGSGEIGRFSAIPDVIRLIYNGDVSTSIFGVGLGVASTSGVMTQFASMYSATNYSWYSLSYIFIETGAIGTIAYLLSFIFPIFLCKKWNRYSKLVQVSCVMSIIIIIYNEALKTEAGYIMFFLLSIAFIKEKNIGGI